jgi:hypothetical protein
VYTCDHFGTIFVHLTSQSTAAVCYYPQDMGAISSVNVLGNEIGIEQAQVFAAILKERPTLKSLCGYKGDETELNMSGKRIGAAGAIMLAPEIVDNRALLVLSLKSNNLGADGGKALAEGLKGNQAITELNISDNNLGNSGFDMSGIIALAGILPDIGALSVLSLKNNKILTKEAGKALAQALAGNSVLTELDVSCQAGDTWDDGPGFVQELAVGIKDNGALVCADGRYYHEWWSNDAYQSADEVISENKEEILSELRQLEEMEDGEEKQEWLREIGCETVPTEEQYLAELTEEINAERIEAGVFKFKSTAPDIEGQDEDPGVPLANGICQHCGQPKDQHHAKGAMTKLDISKCELMAEGGKALAAGLKANQVMKELNVSVNRLGQNVSGGKYVSDMSGVIALADVMPDLGVLTKLDARSNYIGDDGEDALNKAAGRR